MRTPQTSTPAASAEHDVSSNDDVDDGVIDVVVPDVTAPVIEAGESVVAAAEHGRLARHPFQIPAGGWRTIAWRVKREWGDDHVGLAAAAVAFYSFLALIPALAALVSILGLVARGRNPNEVIDDLFGALPGEAKSLLSEQLAAITEQSTSSLSFGLVIGVVLSLWSASGAIGQLVNTVNIAYDEKETRSWWRRKATAIALTFGAIVFVAMVIAVVVLLPPLVERTGLGLGTRRLLNVLVWPVLAAAFASALAVLYRFGPDRRPAQWRWVSVGAGFSVAGFTAVTLGFRIYVSQFGSYNETYGSLSAVVVILLWLWLTAVIVLLGAEINAEIEHQTSVDTTVGRERPMGSRGAVKADSLGELR
jgi:membrane protein